MATQMNIQDCTALGARKAYTLRPYKHFGWGAVAFIPIFTGLIFILNPLVAGLIAGGLAFGLYFFLESRLMVIECPNCQQDINVNTPWECGFKGCRNENVDEFPFVHECEHCHYPPKAYVCHHCGSHIFLTSDRQKIHAAKRLEFPKPVPPPVNTVTVVLDPAKDKEIAQKIEKRDLQHELDVATYKKKIEIVQKMSAESPQTRTESDAIKERILKEIQKGKTYYQVELEELAKVRAECANNPDMLPEMENLVREAVFNARHGL